MKKKTVFVAYQYLNNHNHGQIYIQSSQGAAANNSISCHRNIKHPRNNHSICYIFLCFVHEFVLINSNYVLLYFTLCIRNVNASVSVKTLMYQVCHSTYSNQSGSLLTLLGLKSSEQNQSVFASKCCRASGSKRWKAALFKQNQFMSPQKCDSDFYSAGNNETHLQRCRSNSKSPIMTNFTALLLGWTSDHRLSEKTSARLKQEVKMFALTRAGPLFWCLLFIPISNAVGTGDYVDRVFTKHVGLMHAKLCKSTKSTLHRLFEIQFSLLVNRLV